MRKSAVICTAVFLLFFGVLYAIAASFETTSPPTPNQPGSASSYRSTQAMQPIQQGVNPQDAAPYDDGITWSWEEEVAPIDFIQFSQSLPYDEWVEIDDVTLRGLFEDVIRRALAKMEIEGNGGEFEKVLRDKLLYFTPEHEYYWPPYEEDFSKREVKFPIKVIRKKNDIGEMLIFHLGRFADEDRNVEISMNDKYSFLPSLVISVKKQKYLPGVSGPPKVEHLFLNIYNDKAELKRYYWDMAYEYNSEEGKYVLVKKGIFRDDGVIQEYQKGSSDAVVNNIQSEPELDLSGIDILFDLPKSPPLNLDWGEWDPALFQTYSSIINLCKLQLNLADNGNELGRVLWRDFFRFDYDTKHFGIDSEDVNIARIATGRDDRELFLFDVGNIDTARYIYLTLSKEFAPPGYEWGVEQISLSRAIMVQGAVGEEARVFEFGFRVGEVPFALYMLTQSDNEGHTVLDKPVAFFKYGTPYNMITPEE